MEQKQTPKLPLFKRLKRYLLAGFVVVAPSLLTLYIIFWLVRISDRWARSILPLSVYEETRILGIPGMGVLILLALLIGIGYFASGWIGRTIINFADGIFANMPVVSSLYSTLKKLFQAILGENTTSFRQVVYVEFPRQGCWSIGFITGSMEEKDGILPDNLLCVFVPTTPNPTSGFLVMVPENQIRRSSMKVEEAMKMIVSLGMTK